MLSICIWGLEVVGLDNFLVYFSRRPRNFIVSNDREQKSLISLWDEFFFYIIYFYKMRALTLVVVMYFRILTEYLSQKNSCTEIIAYLIKSKHYFLYLTTGGY